MASNTERLWAKSQRKNEPLRPSMYLLGHLQDVYVAALRILDATGEDQLHALGLDSQVYFPRFRRCVLLAAAVHDIGKANSHFQDMITGKRNILQNPQGLRHEWVTVLMLQSLKIWLLPAVGGNETDFAIVAWAVAGHHPAVTHQSPPTTCPENAGVDVTFLLNCNDGLEIIGWLSDVFREAELAARGRSRFSRFRPLKSSGKQWVDSARNDFCHGLLGPLPAMQNLTRSLAESDDVFTEIAKLWGRAWRVWDSAIAETDDRKLLAAVKDCLIAADIAGSALPKAIADEKRRWDWITAAFANRPNSGDLGKVCSARLGKNSPRDFQIQVAASDEAVTLVKAGCGTGKTLAAYMWTAKHHPTRRLYFCYPTTGTATEGFKDYLYEPAGELGKLGARLFHSRAEIDFEIILGTGPDSRDDDRDLALKLESLEAWSTPIVSCTVDTVLGIVQNNKRGLFAWPALAQSAFVFDEIHSYDDRLFGALLRFLRDLPGLPALLMTASLPRAREEALRKALYLRGIKLTPIVGPKDLEERPRYHKTTIASKDPVTLIAEELKSGGKVLWVCNTVARVLDAADRAIAAGLTPMLYHSRFRYVDRVERHNAVVESFTPEHPDAALAICSQVAEMSLDLKGCTMLVTDLAPVAALIQRFGRLNRQADDGDPTRPFIIIEPDGSKPYLPYSAEELEAARQWIEKLPAEGISQRNLSDKWEQADDALPEHVDSAWLDGGPCSTVTELRELSPGISVLLREDVDRMLASRDDDVGRYVIPMNQPHGVAWQQWCKHKGIPIAEPGFIRYDGKRGAQWEKERSFPVLII